MNHRHLLPDEIDLLLDDEVGFGVTPLKAHIRDCAQCRTQVDEARRFVGALEDLPHFAPSHTFTDRVMSQVAASPGRGGRLGDLGGIRPYAGNSLDRDANRRSGSHDRRRR